MILILDTLDDMESALHTTCDVLDSSSSCLSYNREGLRVYAINTFSPHNKDSLSIYR